MSGAPIAASSPTTPACCSRAQSARSRERDHHGRADRLMGRAQFADGIAPEESETMPPGRGSITGVLR